MHNGSNTTTFGLKLKLLLLKSSELHKLIRQNGWVHIRTRGSHYIYEKGKQIYPVPFHGVKEMGKGIETKIKKEMGLK